MKLYPNCKINLGLNIVSKRLDGYHNIETVFLPIPLADCLELDSSLRDEFEIDGQKLDCESKDNLVIKVLNMLRDEGYYIPPVSIRLTKNIPSGAGLGGGSSDAAFMMKGLNQLFRLGMSDTEMEKKVRKLGADCPVFIKNRPVYAQGIGDEFSELPVALMNKQYPTLPPVGTTLPPTTTLSIPASLHGYWLVLVKPDDFISTKEAYSQVHAHPSDQSLTDIMRLPVREWRHHIHNQFEDSVFPQHPTLTDIREQMYQLGARYAAMSGSGSTMYGLWRQRPQLGDVFQDWFQWMCQL